MHIITHTARTVKSGLASPFTMNGSIVNVFAGREPGESFRVYCYPLCLDLHGWMILPEFEP
jgi:hypothetical protein